MPARITAAPRRSLLLLASVLSLCLLSLLYGLVTGRLAVSGMVLTDDVNATWYGGGCVQTAPVPQPGLVSTALTPDALDPAAVNLSIGNAFPGLVVECQVALANTGLLPIRLLGVAVENNTGGAVVSELLGTPASAVLTPCSGAPAWGATPEPAACHTSQGVRIRITDAAQQNTRYVFAVRLCVAQESVSAPASQCFAGIAAPVAAPLLDQPAPAQPPVQPSPAPGLPPAPSPAPPAPDQPAGSPVPAATPSAGGGASPAAVPAVATAVTTPAPTVEVLPLTPPPATATPGRTAAPQATATRAPVVQVLPLTPPPAQAPVSAPAPPRLPNTGAGPVATASDIGLDVLLALLAVTGTLWGGVQIWLRRRNSHP